MSAQRCNAEEGRVPDPTPGTERPYQVDNEWSRAVFARRTGQVAAFLAPYL